MRTVWYLQEEEKKERKNMQSALFLKWNFLDLFMELCDTDT